MKTTFKKYYFIIIISLLVSCVEDYNIDYKDYQSEIAIMGICMPDSILKLYVTKSSPMTEKDIRDTSYKGYVLEDALVELWDDHLSIGGLSKVNDRLYVSDNKAELNSKYYLRVSAPGMATVYAEAEIPPPPEILDIKYDGFVETDINGNEYAQIRITFKDPAEQQNYYEIETLVDVNFFDYLFFQPQTYSKDPVILAENYSFKSFYNGISFSDKLINGQEYELKILINHFYDTRAVMVVLKGVTKEYYDHKKNMELYSSSLPTSYINTDPTTGLPFGVEPRGNYSNIEKGQGLFTGISFDRDTIFLQK